MIVFEMIFSFMIGVVAICLMAMLGCFLQMLENQQKEWNRGVSNGWRKSRLEEVIASGEWDDLPWDLQSDLLHNFPSSCTIHGQEAEKCGRKGHMAWTGWKGK